MTYRVVLFDLDGTLTNPGVGIANSVRHALTALRLPQLSSAQLRSFVGPPLQESFSALGLMQNEVDAAVDAYRAYFVDKGMYENHVYEGIADMLTALSPHAVRLAVATSKPTVFAQRILEHFGLDVFLEQVVGAELDGTRRHKHEVIAEVLARLDCPSHDAVMVGDMAQDVVGAAKVGLSCIGVSWGYGEPGELETAGAKCVVSTPEELLTSLLLKASP